MTLSEMKWVLADGDIQLTKSLGQNFLHDGNQLRRIVEAAELSPSDRVLEIGPGLGPITELLVGKTAEVLAIEKDLRLVERLRGRMADAKGLTLLHDDALEYLRRQPRDWSGWKLVANLPYSVASTLLVELAAAPVCPDRLVSTLQLEVAHRLMAGAGDQDYGVFTLLIQLRYELRAWFKIPASCFHPPPDVDSACVILLRRPQPLLEADMNKTFTRLVKRGFSQRRKMMLKLLKAEWPLPRLEQAFAQLGISPQARAESLGLPHFVDLARLLGGPVDAGGVRP